MENGVQIVDKPLSEEETKTADDSVSQLKLAENAVQVFHESNDSDDVDVKPLSENETKTADGGISQLKLVEKVVQVFHESKDSEGDDVFEEAMADVHTDDLGHHHFQDFPDRVNNQVNGDGYKMGESDVLEVNGTANEAHDAENFEEAVEVDVLSEDPSSEVDERVFIEDSVDEKEKPVVEDSDDYVEKLEVNGGVTQVVDSDKFEEAVDRSLQVEEPVVVEERLKALVDSDTVDEVRAVDAVADDGDTEEVVNGVIEGRDSCVTVGGEKISSTNWEVESSAIFRAAVSDKSENGDMGELEFEEEPYVVSKSLDVQQASPDQIKLSEENESSGRVVSQDEQIHEMTNVTADVDTSIDKDMYSLEVKTFSSDLCASVGEETKGTEIETPTSVEYHDSITDERVKDEAAEFEAENGQVHLASEKTKQGSDNHATVKVSEVGEERNDDKRRDSPSVGTSVGSVSAREPEIQPSVEPAQPPRPAGLGGAAPLLEPAPRLQQPRVNGAMPQRQAQLVEDTTNGEAEENDETREKLQMIRVKFLRLAHRLGQTPHNVVVAQVLYRLGLAEQLRGRNAGRSGAFSFDRASAMAEQIEAAGQEPLDFSCTIMVLGKTGVGKSATINSIFDEVKFSTDAFQMGTKKVQDVVGTVQGIKVRVIDTPGLLPCSSDQRQNEKILHSVKRFIKKNPPDIVLYLDRLDMQSRDFGDLPLLRTITEIFGPSIWFNAIVVLTHAASAPPDGPNGISSSYEMFVTQRSHVVQQAIRQAAGDMRLMNPVSLVENHSACRTNRAGQRVLPNGQVWKPHLLLLSFASKILAEANTLLKLQDSPPGKPFATRSRVPPLPFLLSSLLQSRPQLKLPEEQMGDEDDLDEDLDDSSDSDGESEYDELPPFKPLTQAQLAKLSKVQKQAYFDELEYREKLFMKKQLREERKRRKLLKKMATSAKDLPDEYNESAEEESGGSATVPVALPDFTLPASFDSDNPTHRYRFLETSNQWLVRPVLETHGWDHDVGYEGINVERLFVVKEKIPLSFSGQVTKDKKESNLQMELSSSIKHNEGKATSVVFDMQTVGKDMAYTLRSETRFSNFRHNKTAAGLSVTLLGDAITAGVKVEDRLIVNKRFRLVLTGGAMTGRGDVAYGGSLEATLRDKDYPLGRALSTLGLSIMDWHGDLAIGCNLQSQIPVGRSTNLIARGSLNNRGSGQVSIRLNSTEQIQIALIGLLPLVRKIYGHYQQVLYGE